MSNTALTLVCIGGILNSLSILLICATLRIHRQRMDRHWRE